MSFVTEVKQKLPGHMLTPFHYFRYMSSDRKKYNQNRPWPRPLGYDRIYFYHIRKTAGTSLCFSFLNLSGLDFEAEHHQEHYGKNGWLVLGDYVYVTHNRYLIQRGKYFFGDSHLPAHELQIPHNSFRMTILRDPVARVLSHYRMLRYWRDHGVEHPGKTRKENNPGNNFSEFLDNIPRTHLLRQLYMFSKTFSVDEAVHWLSGLNFVARTERYGHDLAKLGAILDLDLRSFKEKAGYGQVQIDDAEHARLRELLAPEYQMINAIAPRAGVYRETR